MPPESRLERRLSPILDPVRDLVFAPTESGLVKKLLGPAYGPMRFRYHLQKQKRVARQQQELRLILEQHDRTNEIIVFAPGLPWAEEMLQRPQQLALALARQGALVFYCSVGAQSAAGADFEQIEPCLYLCCAPLETFWFLEGLWVYVLTWNRRELLRFNQPRAIYDHLDDLDLFTKDRSRMTREHAKLLKNTEVVLGSSARLVHNLANVRPDALLCPNGVDLAHFREDDREQDAVPPQDLAPILQAGRPVVGYYGALARWFDYDLLANSAAARPGYTFLLIGPSYDGSLQGNKLLSLPNVYWLGVKSYHELPHYLHYFDIAVIPFVLNDLTHATSPLKLFEYMAAGKPVVITAMQESMRFAGVLTAHDAHEFIGRLDEAMQLRHDPAYLEIISQTAAENTWDARARQILQAISGRPPTLVQ